MLYDLYYYDGPTLRDLMEMDFWNEIEAEEKAKKEYETLMIIAIKNGTYIDDFSKSEKNSSKSKNKSPSKQSRQKKSKYKHFFVDDEYVISR